MDIASIIGLVLAVGSAGATAFLWWSKAREESAHLAADWLGPVKPIVRRAGDEPTAWLGMECRTIVTNLSTLPNILLAATGEIRLPDGRWLNQTPPRGLGLGGPTPLPLELPAQQAMEVKLCVWVEIPYRDQPAAERARECVTWPPVLRLRLDALDGRRFTLDLPLAEDA